MEATPRRPPKKNLLELLEQDFTMLSVTQQRQSTDEVEYLTVRVHRFFLEQVRPNATRLTATEATSREVSGNPGSTELRTRVTSLAGRRGKGRTRCRGTFVAWGPDDVRRRHIR